MKEETKELGRQENPKPGRKVKKNPDGTKTPDTGKGSKPCRTTRKGKPLENLHLKGQNRITKYLELKSTTDGDVGLDIGLGII